jgi:hypothetical protein
MVCTHKNLPLSLCWLKSSHLMSDCWTCCVKAGPLQFRWGELKDSLQWQSFQRPELRTLFKLYCRIFFLPNPSSLPSLLQVFIKQSSLFWGCPVYEHLQLSPQGVKSNKSISHTHSFCMDLVPYSNSISAHRILIFNYLGPRFFLPYASVTTQKKYWNEKGNMLIHS